MDQRSLIPSADQYKAMGRTKRRGNLARNGVRFAALQPAAQWCLLTVICLTMTLSLAGCYQQPLPDLSQLPVAPDGHNAAGPSGRRWHHYAIDPNHSLLSVKVFRSGRLARLGHNHIISTSQLSGWIVGDGDQIMADLFVRLDQLDVDSPVLRAAAGPEFASSPSDDDIADTRANMLSGKVLDASQFPFLRFEVDRLESDTLGTRAVGRLTISGLSRDVKIPIKIAGNTKQSRVTASFDVRQSDFAIKPFTVLGGALGTADQLKVHITLVAARDDRG